MSKISYTSACLLLALILLWGCSQSPEAGAPGNTRLEVAANVSSASGSGVVLSTVRIIAADNSGAIVYNRSTDNGLAAKPGADNTFEIALRGGIYTIYTVANETPEMSAAFDAAASEADLRNIRVKGSFTEATVPLAQSEQIILRQQKGQIQISSDGGNTWQDRLAMELVRTQSKVSLYLRKKVGSADVVVIKKVEVCNLPRHSYLIQKAYTPATADLQTITPYDDATGIRFEADIVDEADKSNYTTIFTAGNIFPERWTADPSSDAEAAYLKIHAEYNGLQTTYTIKLHGDPGNGYNLVRNVDHIVYATITGTGDLDASNVYIEAQWWTEQVSGDIETPYLNLSETTLPIVFTRTADGTTTFVPRRIFFWSNMPQAEITMGDVVKANDGTEYTVPGDMAADLTFTKSEAVTGGGYNTAGYVDLTATAGFGWSIFNTEATEYEIRITAGQLTKKLVLERKDYLTTTKFSDMPWVGIFYTAAQKGERIISAMNDGDWTAETEYPSGTTAFVLMDPSLSTDEQLYTDTPTDAEQFPVTSGAQTLSGNGRIYFRVGLTGTSYTSRAARIKLTTTSGTYYIYVKQGTYDNVMSSGDPASSILADGTLGGSVARTATQVKSISQYPMTYYSSLAGGSALSEQILNSSSINSGLAEGGTPTRAQQFFCWNVYNGVLTSSPNRYTYYLFHATSPWTGPISPYPHTSAINPNLTFNTALYRRGCPDGYHQPTVDQLRYSLFRNIPEKTADGNYAMAANAADRNYQWGYCADGYFDRRKSYSVESNTGSGTVTTPPCAVSQGGNIAYCGLLFYNPDSYTSLFLPAAGYRDAANGELRMPGLGGFLWTQTGDPTDAKKKYGLLFSNINGNLECRIVGNVHPARAASIRCMKD